VGIDRPDDPDVPPDEHSDRPANRPPAETRYRQDYYVDLRAATGAAERTEPAGRSEPGARAKPAEPTDPAAHPEPGAGSKPAKPTENGHQTQPTAPWEQTAELSRWMWTEYKRRWPPDERPPADRSNDPPGSWRGDNGRFFSSAVNHELDEACDRTADLERNTISPGLREIEGCDTDRHLIGFRFRLKGRDRIKEKVAKSMAEKGLSHNEAFSRVPDAIRYTLQYDDAHYTQGVWADIVRMKEQGFKLNILKNSWSADQYKGINSQWTEPRTGQRFELQFHTRISFEAKQITHNAYERLRTKQPDPFEEMVLEAFQKKVTAEVPVPPGAAEIPEYPERGRDA
jgi:hypothetical protein